MWILIVVIVACLVVWVISVQNKLVKSDELCKNALKQIGVQQTSRYDALLALVKLTREYASYESETLQKVIAERKIVSSPNPTVADINANEAALKEIGARLIAVAERYPDLKANENYTKAMDAVDKYTNMVRTSKMVYNDTATNYNKLIRQIPDSFVASIFGFKVREYLKIEDQKTGMPSLKI